jgi:hypothetical protein
VARIRSRGREGSLLVGTSRASDTRPSRPAVARALPAGARPGASWELKNWVPQSENRAGVLLPDVPRGGYRSTHMVRSFRWCDWPLALAAVAVREAYRGVRYAMFERAGRATARDVQPNRRGFLDGGVGFISKPFVHPAVTERQGAPVPAGVGGRRCRATFP